jgi:transposase InsO family protein
MPRSGRCSGCWPPFTAACASNATSSPTRPTPSRSSLRPARPRVWSWDISKLLGPAKWTYFYLYVILDVFSRYAVGWTALQKPVYDGCRVQSSQRKNSSLVAAAPPRTGSRLSLSRVTLIA